MKLRVARPLLISIAVACVLSCFGCNPNPRSSHQYDRAYNSAKDELDRHVRNVEANQITVSEDPRSPSKPQIPGVECAWKASSLVVYELENNGVLPDNPSRAIVYDTSLKGGAPKRIIEAHPNFRLYEIGSMAEPGWYFWMFDR